MVEQTSTPVQHKPSRRELIAGAAGALGVVAAHSVVGAEKALAADGDPVILGAANTETGITTIRNEAIGNAAGLIVTAAGGAPGVLGRGGPTFVFPNSGIGVWGEGGVPNGVGVLGDGQGTGPGVRGRGGFEGGTGVDARGGFRDGIGVTASGGGSGMGVQARGGPTGGTGVDARGGAANGIGVQGTGGGQATGVHGVSNDPKGRGVVAENTAGGIGLQVSGPAVFSRSGLATVPTGSRGVTVTGVSLTAGSIVLAAVQQASSRSVRTAVPDAATSSLTITLTATADVDTTVGWFVVN